MAYIDSKNHTVLLSGDRIILQEKHQNCLYTFEKGEEVKIKYAESNGSNYYAIVSLDNKKRMDGVILGGLTDNSIVITHHANTENPRKKQNLGADILRRMFQFIEDQHIN